MFNAVRKFFEQAEVIDTAASSWAKQNNLTPDLWRLEQYQRQLFFVPDDLKVGGKNHDLIGDHLPIHPACYTLKELYVWKKDLGDHSYPVPLEEEIKLYSKYNAEPARLKGELYAIPGGVFKRLDIHKQNTVQFHRKRVPITVPYRHVRYSTASPIPTISKDYLHTVSAWMYFGIQDYWKDMIGVSLGSKAVDMYEPNAKKDWIDKYYKF